MAHVAQDSRVRLLVWFCCMVQVQGELRVWIPSGVANVAQGSRVHLPKLGLQLESTWRGEAAIGEVVWCVDGMMVVELYLMGLEC